MGGPWVPCAMHVHRLMLMNIMIPNMIMTIMFRIIIVVTILSRVMLINLMKTSGMGMTRNMIMDTVMCVVMRVCECFINMIISMYMIMIMRMLNITNSIVGQGCGCLVTALCLPAWQPAGWHGNACPAWPTHIKRTSTHRH